jgi:hypothetical protein
VVMSRSFAAFLCAVVIAVPSLWAAQAQNQPPRLFPQFDGTWTLDERAAGTRITPGAVVARTIDIVTSPTGVVVMKDGAPGEVYRFDNQQPELPGGAVAEFRHSFTLVGDMLALTKTRSGSRDGRRTTRIITEGYAVSADVLTVERQLSVLVEPPGILAAFGNPADYHQMFVYRRVAATAAR